jgi:hypothetical protein
MDLCHLEQENRWVLERRFEVDDSEGHELHYPKRC